jgi:hypothetical protein
MVAINLLVWVKKTKRINKTIGEVSGLGPWLQQLRTLWDLFCWAATQGSPYTLGDKSLPLFQRELLPCLRYERNIRIGMRAAPIPSAI